MKLFSFIISLLGFAGCAHAQSESLQTLDALAFAHIIHVGDTAANDGVPDTAMIQLVDVRTAEEYAAGHIGHAVNIDVLQPDFLNKAKSQLSPNRRVAVYCRSGKRSLKAATLLAKAGYRVVNLKGGWLEWTSKNLPIQ